MNNSDIKQPPMSEVPRKRHLKRANKIPTAAIATPTTRTRQRVATKIYTHKNALTNLEGINFLLFSGSNAYWPMSPLKL